MGFDSFVAEEQGANQTWDGSLDGYQLAPAGFDAEKNQQESQVVNGNLDPYGLGLETTVTEKFQSGAAHFSAWEWGGDQMELEISKEAVHAPIELTPSSLIPSSTSTTENTSLSADGNPAVQSDKGPSNTVVRSSSASNDTNTAYEWLCDFTNCGKSFTHRHQLNRHRKCHFKPYQCLQPSCATRRIAFSLKKDLLRHQAKHNGQRFYCHHAGCSYAIGGTKCGFTRKDNRERHMTRRH